jgi:tetratricopeptide (TPR) repeat protein
MAVTLPNTALSANDARILNALFDPETLPSSVGQQKDLSSSIDPSLPAHPSISTPQLTALERQQSEIVGRISSTSSISEIDAAIAELNAIIEQWPEYASAWVNRAMVRRMKLEATLEEGKTIFVTTTETSSLNIEAVLSDLAQAIKLSLSSSPSTAAVSPHAAKVLRTAYSHRAYLYLKAVESETRLHDLTKSELEEQASKDFAAAARYGDDVAREMSVRTNPYKKMCGVIVRDALREERGGGGGGVC